ncbi:RNA polymerase II subunit A C-terminal domain phosphatase isoform X2 [Thrips palmi]|nr:RNA polymerase II subunit A C-terminal domain phosphatase isoform X2 [Thrips palmi]XP_034237099.1 RNA polymerase II subunit A C-terminal domain phosphatase isoform X2 [Thrips palmi]
MADMCADCGADLRNEDTPKDNNVAVASIPMVHSIPELKVNAEQAQILGKADEQRLLASKKLVLLVDLDQTLIHTTNDDIPPNLKDVFHFRLHGSRSPWHHTRLRPGTKKFLEEMSALYELHICTFGSRMYAHKIAQFLDPDGQYFSHRILSRDECLSANSKTANLKALFPCGDDMVCIIDDREDVWNFANNLIHVKPYHFFQHTGDINAPPGLSKKENDDKGAYDFNCLGDGKKIKDILRPNIPGKGQELPKDGVDLVKQKGQNASSENEDAVKPSQLEEGANKTSSFTDENSEQILEENNVTTIIEEKNANSTKDEDKQDVNNVQKEDKIKADNSASNLSSVTDEGKEKMAQEEKPDSEKSCELLEENQISKEEPIKLEDVVVKDDGKLIGDQLEVKDQPPEPDILKNNSSDLKNVKAGEDSAINTQDEIEVPDYDDYLLYLEEILRRIHKEFYEKHAQGKQPDMKEIIPAVRKKVLASTNLVFSGLVPNNIPLERSRAYQVAISLGANVTQDLKKNTTHLVAVRPGTAKVNSARRMKNVHMVTADWLWVSAERWERVDEKVFPLGRNRAGTRHPPAHCGSPEHTPVGRENPSEASTSSGRSRTASGRFMDTINPLLSFSSADIADMDQEVDDIFKDSDSESDSDGGESSKREKTTGIPEMEVETEDDSQTTGLPSAPTKTKAENDDSESSSSSADSLSGEHPHGWGKHNLKRKNPDYKLGTGTATESDEEADDMPSTKFRRGEALPSDLDLGENESADSPGSEDPPDEIDDGDWNMMGAALEREFLS